MNNSSYVLEKKVMASDGDRFINCIIDVFFVFVTIFIFSFILVIVGSTFNIDVFSMWQKIIIEDTYLLLFGFFCSIIYF
jgi:hypothetical protein